MSNNRNVHNMLNFKNCTDFEQCHLMPCRIEHKEINVNAKEYFWPTINEMKGGGDEEQGRERKPLNGTATEQQKNDAEKNPILVGSFRGRPLQGKKVELPKGYKGVVVINNDDKSKSFKRVKEFYYWNWDEIPSKDDKVIKALQWIELSNAIHGGLIDLS